MSPGVFALGQGAAVLSVSCSPEKGLTVTGWADDTVGSAGSRACFDAQSTRCCPVPCRPYIARRPEALRLCPCVRRTHRRHPAPWLVAAARPKSGKAGPPPFTPANPAPTLPAHLGPIPVPTPLDPSNLPRHQARSFAPPGGLPCATFSAPRSGCPYPRTPHPTPQIFGEMLEEKHALLQALGQRDPEASSRHLLPLLSSSRPGSLLVPQQFSSTSQSGRPAV